jgi:hypothetical protein
MWNDLSINFFIFLRVYIIGEMKTITTSLAFNKHFVTTLLLEEWEDDTHTPEMGTWESIGTSKTSEFNFRGQNTLH